MTSVQPTVQSLHLYPVKSARGHAVERMWLDRFGPQGDRRWMLVDAAGRFVSQREDARLARLDVALTPSGLRLSFGGDSFEIDVPSARGGVEVEVWNDRVPALDAGEAVADWLSRHFERPLRLVYMPDDCRRRVDPDYAARGETVSFADGFPLLLVSAAALDTLNERLSSPVTLDRFRPNIVVADCPAHAEDDWRRLRIGDVEFTVVKPCARCAVPSLDPRSGEKHPEILRVLAGYRRWPDRKVYFGQNLLYDAPGGPLEVGDTVEILA